MSAIHVGVVRDHRAATLVLLGELDISTAGRVEAELRRVEGEGADPIVLDLRRLEFLDSSGLRLVVAADARAREAGRGFAVVRGPDTVHRVFEITFVDRRLRFVDDPSEVTGPR